MRFRRCRVGGSVGTSRWFRVGGTWWGYYYGGRRNGWLQGYHGVAVVGGILYLAEYPALDHIKILNCKAWSGKEKDNKTFHMGPSNNWHKLFSPDDDIRLNLMKATISVYAY
jgi:hypothetical protein